MYSVHGRVIVDNMYEFQQKFLKKVSTKVKKSKRLKNGFKNVKGFFLEKQGSNSFQKGKNKSPNSKEKSQKKVKV